VSDLQRILVTGGAGFLGSHLCDRLIREGRRVLCMDNLVTGSVANIEHLIGEANFELIERDVIGPIDPGLVGDLNRIYNLACPASPPQYQRDPVFTLKTSVLGALNLLELAQATGARILQASTSEVYGDPEVSPQPESYRGRVNPIGPRACYDEGKRAAETLFFDFHRCRGVDIRVVRIFNTYGPRLHRLDGRVVSNFICQALSGEDLTIYGDGSQTRSFCYVDDLIEGLVRMMEGPADFIGPVNLGNCDEMTIERFARLVIELTGSSSQVRKVAAAQDDPAQRRPDLRLAQTRLNWRPTVALCDGLARTIEWFRSAGATDNQSLSSLS